MSVVDDVVLYNAHSNFVNNRDKKKAIREMNIFYKSRGIHEMRIYSQFAIMCYLWIKLCYKYNNGYDIDVIGKLIPMDHKHLIKLSEDYKMQPYDWGEYNMLRHDTIKLASSVYSGRERVDISYRAKYDEKLRDLEDKFSNDSNKYVDHRHYNAVIKRDNKDADIEINVITGVNEDDTTKLMRKYLRDHSWFKHTNVVTNVVEWYCGKNDINETFGGATKHEIKTVLDNYVLDRDLNKLSQSNQFAVLAGLLNILSTEQMIGHINIKDMTVYELKGNDTIYSLFFNNSIKTIAKNNEENRYLPEEWDQFEEIRKSILIEAMNKYDYNTTKLTIRQLGIKLKKLDKLIDQMYASENVYIDKRWLKKLCETEMSNIMIETDIINGISDKTSDDMNAIIHGYEY